MGLEDDARWLNAAQQAAAREAVQQARDSEQVRQTPVSNELSIELASVIAKHGHRAEPFYRIARPGKWEKFNRGWTIWRSVRDEDSRTGYVGRVIFVLGADGSLWNRGTFVQSRKMFDGLSSRGGLSVSEALTSWAVPSDYQRQLFTTVAAHAMATQPSKSAGDLTLPAGTQL